jgi:hypothetical protein
MYQIAVSRANQRVDLDFIGNYTDIDRAELARDLHTAVLQAKARGDHFDLLVDFTQVSVMPQDRTAAARDEIEWCVANGLRRSANVMSSTISKMQVERLSADERFQVFANRAGALAWLSSV